MDGINDIIDTFLLSEDKDEMDCSSCDLNDFPPKLFELPIQQLTYLVMDYNNIVRLPPLINQLVCLIELSLNGNELVCLPQEIGELQNLETLLLNENRLCTLPDELGQLHSLKKLTAIGNNLHKLPSTLPNLRKLEELYLDENQLCYLPENFGDLCCLKILEICHNQLNYLPDDIGNACLLEVISCGSNLIKMLPSSFAKLRNLRFMDFSSNKLQSLPDEFSDICLLEKLYLENNAMEILPDWVSKLSCLEELTLSDNTLCNEPFNYSFCQNLKMLQKLEAGGNFISSLGSNFGEMRKLEYLHLGSTISELERSNFQNGNWIKELPESICNLKNLSKVNINENQICKLPDLFGNLTMLKYLDLGQNMLEFLPVSFSCLVNLEYLQLSKNQLKKLPKDMGCLQRLQELRLDHNLLKEIPPSVGSIVCLQALDLFHNHLTEIPSFITSLRNLKRLDIDGNEFTIDLGNVPRILPGVKYPKRDPTLKDNWRGKYRADKYAPGELNEVEINQISDGEEVNEEEYLNEKALKMALERGMSLWRSHSGPATREVEETKQNGAVNDDDWVAYVYNAGVEKKLSDLNKDVGQEDWDKEIEEHNMQKVSSAAKEKEKRSSSPMTFRNIMQKYPASEQAFSATACYDSFLYGTAKLQQQYPVFNSRNFVVVDGQFDNV